MRENKRAYRVPRHYQERVATDKLHRAAGRVSQKHRERTQCMQNRSSYTTNTASTKKSDEKYLWQTWIAKCRRPQRNLLAAETLSTWTWRHRCYYSSRRRRRLHRQLFRRLRSSQREHSCRGKCRGIPRMRTARSSRDHREPTKTVENKGMRASKHAWACTDDVTLKESQRQVSWTCCGSNSTRNILLVVWYMIRSNDTIKASKLWRNDGKIALSLRHHTDCMYHTWALESTRATRGQHIT